MTKSEITSKAEEDTTVLMQIMKPKNNKFHEGQIVVSVDTRDVRKYRVVHVTEGYLIITNLSTYLPYLVVSHHYRPVDIPIKSIYEEEMK